MSEIINIKIDDKQAKKFAKAIYPDILDYVKANQDEYKEFLKTQNKLKIGA